MRKRFCLDRVESGIAVCLCEDEDNAMYELALTDAPALRGLADGTLFEAALDPDGIPREIVVLKDETERRRAQNRARLQALLDKSKRKN